MIQEVEPLSPFQALIPFAKAFKLYQDQHDDNPVITSDAGITITVGNLRDAYYTLQKMYNDSPNRGTRTWDEVWAAFDKRGKDG